MTIESKDRAALRGLHALLHTLAEESIEALPDVHVEVLADLAARARLALAEPDPCAEVAEALRSIARDNLDYAQITALAEAALAKVHA